MTWLYCAVLTVPQSLYAMGLLYILTLGASKLAVLVLVRNLTLLSLHRILIYATAGLITFWTVTSVFVAAFQCPLPHTWAILNAKCIDQVRGIQCFVVRSCSAKRFSASC